jgi:hypothetical protein
MSSPTESGVPIQVRDAEPALPGRRRAAPSGGSVLHEVKSVGATFHD